MKKSGLTLSSKVLFIFIGALILLGALAWGFSKPWRGPWRDQIPKVLWLNLRSHFIELTDKLAVPPNAENAAQVLKDLRLDLIVRENGQTLFSTTKDLPPWNEFEEEIQQEVRMRASRPTSLRAKYGDFVVGRAQGRLFASVDRGPRRFIFLSPDSDTLQSGLRAFSGFAFTIAFLMLIILAVTRWLLRPLKPLMVGVGELSKGHLGYRVSIQPRGEFRRVAEAFNDMAETLQRQLKSKDQLLMDVSHELRSPLGRIKMAAEMLPHDEPRAEGLRAQIQGDVREMEELVTELLELYRLPAASLKRTSVDLGALVREVAGPLVQQRPGVEYRLPSEPTLIVADEKQLKRAIRNIVENALKFSRHQARPVAVTLTTFQDRGLHIIEVRDYGVGMTAEQSLRIFEPFFRADSSRVRETGGFGLGLPLAQAIVSAHGGSIECEGQLDQGCVFRILLPAR